MVKWIALIIALFVLFNAASADKVALLADRVTAIESRKCTLMVVSVPGGTATVCIDKP